jgi:hypothetical protein
LMETTCMEGDNELYLVILELRHTWGIFEWMCNKWLKIWDW